MPDEHPRREASRKYEIVVFGATGFTGRKTAEYLARNAPPDLRWAIAGRNRERLESLKEKLDALGGIRGPVGTVIATVEDAGSLESMAALTQVVLTTVGPFVEYGEPVLAACVRAGTDYVDSTGEPRFWRMMLERHAAEGVRRGVRLVSSCGFDSIPADLGALFTIQKLPEGEPIQLSGYMRLQAVFSGGTERSAIQALATPEDPHALLAAPADPTRKVHLGKAEIRRHSELGGWAAPLPTIDASIVLRSAASIGRYGPSFTYRHHAVHSSLAVLVAASVVFKVLAFLVRFEPLRRLFLALVKKSGEGPTDEQMQRSWFKLTFIAECAGRVLRTEVSGGDPGYGETSKMLAESALCLARDRDALPRRAGLLTPAEAMGNVLIERLQRAGLRFDVLGG